MKIYKTQSEVEKDIKNGVLAIEGDVKFECSISIEAKIIVNAGNINARDINAWDINAGDINARDINAGNISYYAFCCVYNFIKCISIKASREVHQKPICLDGKLEIKNQENSLVGKTVTVEIDDKKYKAIIQENT